MIQARTKVDEKASMKLANIALKKLKIIMLLLGVFFALIGVIIFIASDSMEDGLIWLIAFILGGAIFAVLFPMLLNRNIKKQMNSNQLLKNETYNNYIFEEDFLNIVTETNNTPNSNSTINYTQLFKVLETNDTFYIYISSSQAFIVNKSDIKDNKTNELSTLLKSKLDKRYNDKSKK